MYSFFIYLKIFIIIFNFMEILNVIMIPQFGLICILLKIINVEHLFLCFLASEGLFWRDVCVDLLSGFLYSCQCFDIEVSELFVYFETGVLWIILLATIFSHSLLLFYCSKSFYLTKSHFLFLYYLGS